MGTPRARRNMLVRTERLGVGYSRYSDEKQESIAEQDGINEETATANIIRMVATFSDPDVSRSLADRKGLSELFRYLEAHPEVGFVIVNELERLTAGVGQRQQIIEICQRLNVTLVTEDMGLIEPFDEDKMQQADESAVKSKGEVLKTRRRSRRNLRQKVINGTVAMRPAFGTRMKPLVTADGHVLRSGERLVDAKGRMQRSGVLEEHPDEIEWLRKIFAWAGQDKSNDWIARTLTAQGVPTKSGNSQWRGNTVAGVLSNPLYKGEMTWGRQAVRRNGDGTKYLETREETDPGRITRVSPLGALVDPALWEQINTQREQRLGERRMTRRKFDPQVFDNLVYCGRCGHKMYGRDDGGGKREGVLSWRYFCGSNRTGHAALDGFEGVCPVSRSMSEKKILIALASLGGDSDHLTVRPIRDMDTVRAEKRALTKLVTDLGAERARVLSLTTKGIMTEDECTEALTRNTTQRSAAQAKLEQARADDAGAGMAPVLTTAELNGFATLAPLLGDRSIPVADRVEAIHHIGITRLYVDSPRVVIEFARQHTSIEGGLLSQQHG